MFRFIFPHHYYGSLILLSCADSFFPLGTLMVFPGSWIILPRIHGTSGNYPDNFSVKALQDPFEFYSFNSI